VLGRASAHAFIVASRRRLHIKSFLVLRKFWYVFIWNKYTNSVLISYNYNIYILLLLLLSSFQNNFYLLFTIFHFSNIRYTIKMCLCNRRHQLMLNFPCISIVMVWNCPQSKLVIPLPSKRFCVAQKRKTACNAFHCVEFNSKFHYLCVKKLKHMYP
jgi:hypothetical protein